MSELEDILNYLETTSLEPHDDYISEFSYKDQKILWKYIKDLQEENKELSRIVASKVIYDYDIDTPLKKELSDANLKIVSLEAAIHCYKQEREDLIKWLEDKIKECDKTLEILNSSLYTDEIKSDLSINPIIPKVLVGNFLETLDKVRGINND